MRNHFSILIDRPYRYFWYLSALAVACLALYFGFLKPPPPVAAPQKFPSTPSLVLDLGNEVTLTLTLIKMGEFDMGTATDARLVTARHYPLTHVKITRPFYMGIHEVTRGQWAQFVAEVGYQTKYEKLKNKKAWPGTYGWTGTELEQDRRFNWSDPGFPQTDAHPVVLVDWEDAKAFCRWLKNKTGHKFRLPTEAEWEYAYRAGTTTAYFWGDDRDAGKGYANMPDLAFNRNVPSGKYYPRVNFDDNFTFTAPVGTFKPNPWGLYDMHGNVWEVCEDWQYHYNDPPTASSGGLIWPSRGGSWGDEAWGSISKPGWGGEIAASYRAWYMMPGCTVGFRVVLVPRARQHGL